ncbi:hypothetical protein T439DRAFT_164453 [Meredithblackwellia eburnea MCA 4105]
MELPRLSEATWRDIVEQRYPPSAIQKYRLDKSCTRRWKELFLRSLASFEHRSDSGCSQSQHMTHYLVLHRTYGLTMNRTSTRDYDPLRVFEELKAQNSLTSYTTVEVSIPSKYCFADVNIKALVTIGKSGSFLRNSVITECLTKMGAWKENESGHSILGPVL